ncbi:MAG TPA: adenosylcobinamide-GDP ribazoletransferase [Gallionellaceae bacterium]|nr:adenosylcobinamide-GDP ribazoletransferase [Gallionellaceae bacterium]
MLQQIRLLLTAVQFFTRLPMPAWVGHSPAQLDQSARYFPAIGILVGACCAVVLWLATLALPPTLAVALSMLAGIMLTGAFHEDGLSDFADGMGGGYTREKILAIMKDSRAGSYGVIALVLALLLKHQSLLALCNAHPLTVIAAALIAAHTVSRLLAVSIMFTQRYVREGDEARAKPAAQSLSRSSFGIALLTGAASLVLLWAAGVGAGKLILALGCAVLLRAYLARLMRKSIGGYTGDCLGAVQQITEAGFYLGLLLPW